MNDGMRAEIRRKAQAAANRASLQKSFMRRRGLYRATPSPEALSRAQQGGTIDDLLKAREEQRMRVSRERHAMKRYQLRKKRGY